MQWVLQIALQVAVGMRHMHELQFLHRDLAARNILLDRNLCAKVGDFGMTRSINEENTAASPEFILPVRWAAPECFSRVHSPKGDVVQYVSRFF